MLFYRNYQENKGEQFEIFTNQNNNASLRPL